MDWEQYIKEVPKSHTLEIGVQGQSDDLAVEGFEGGNRFLDESSQYLDTVDGRSPSHLSVSPLPHTMTSPDRSSPHSLTDSALGGEFSTTSPDLARSELSDEREENFECFGERENIDERYESEFPSENKSPLPERNFVRRNSWLRTSLRRTSPNHDNLVPPKRWGSFRTPRQRSSAALASALFHSGPTTGSFNSSGRSSNCDDGDMHSDISIEDDVIDLNNKVHQLQEQVGALAESQANTDDKYTRVKQDNAALTNRIHMLEEHIRELEVRGEEKLEEEQRRNRELVQRLEREKQLEVENYTIRLQNLEKEHRSVNEEVILLRGQIERIKAEKAAAEEQLIEAQNVVVHTQEAHRDLEETYRRDQEEWNNERQANSQVIEELTRELEEVRNSREEQMTRESKVEQSVGEDVFSDLPARIADMETEIRILREQNKRMNESNEELQAQMLNKGLDEGMKIMQETHNSSLAAEFEAMSENESPEALAAELEKMRKALQDQQEVNSHLRSYIDNVLLNIMEKYPELLEVRARK